MTPQAPLSLSLYYYYYYYYSQKSLTHNIGSASALPIILIPESRCFSKTGWHG